MICNLNMKLVLYVLDYSILRKVVDNYHYRTILIDTRTYIAHFYIIKLYFPVAYDRKATEIFDKI